MDRFVKALLAELEAAKIRRPKAVRGIVDELKRRGYDGPEIKSETASKPKARDRQLRKSDPDRGKEVS